MEVTKSVDIAASPGRIWPYMSQPAKVLEWYFPLRKFEYTSSRHDEVGAPLYFEEKTSGGTIKMDCIVTGWEKNKRFAFKMRSGNMMKSYQERWIVEPTVSGSRFTFMERGEIGMGIIGKIIGPLAERSSAATIDKILAKLKGLTEGTNANH
jgi:uncharacterized protein YndB with AHSA1/START domain